MTTHTPLIPEYADDPRMACLVYLYGGKDPREVMEIAIRRHLPSRRALTDEQVLEAYQLRAKGWRLQAIANRFGVSYQLLQGIFNGKTYRDVEPDQEDAA